MSDPWLVLRGISKAYPGVQALDAVDLDVDVGECHAVVGENGAGKSTLMKILAGAVPADAGEIRIGGRLASIDSPLAARRSGVAMIHQELNLLPELSVAENIFLGREPSRRGGLLNRRAMSERSREWLSRLHQDIDPRRPVGDLPLAQQQMVEIVKALSLDARILILDEPSAILTERELAEMFSLLGSLKTAGLAMIYISHRLEEIFRICDRVTVMRDGRRVSTRPVAGVRQADIVQEMVGREVATVFPAKEEAAQEAALEVRNLTRAPWVRDVALSVRRGEIVGLSGLVGAGRTELARCIFGADRPDAGEIRLFGKRLESRTPAQAIRAGIGFLTEDRKSQGLLLNMTIRENVTLANLASVSRLWFVSRKLEESRVRPLAAGLRIRTPSLDRLVDTLSGGNQQKVIVARWLFTESRFLIFDEPTRGIDVGAKAEIYQLITDLAAAGNGVLMISSELPEILGLCHRVYVMREGAVAGEFPAATATQESLLAAAMGLPLSRT